MAEYLAQKAAPADADEWKASRTSSTCSRRIRAAVATLRPPPPAGRSLLQLLQLALAADQILVVPLMSRALPSQRCRSGTLTSPAVT